MARKYEQRRRKQLKDETRRRIVDATIALHTTVGPAHTTVKAIAERAGVQRLTVYRHFPDEPSLFKACSGEGWRANPPPDPTAWKRYSDPEERLRAGLTELYVYYGRVGDGFLTIIQDYPLVPLLAELNAPQFEQWTRMRDALAQPWRRRGRRRRLLLAAIEHALDLKTWQSLVRERGLSDQEAIDLLAGLVRCT
jgi:AcrR family transcriptional regulator